MVSIGLPADGATGGLPLAVPPPPPPLAPCHLAPHGETCVLHPSARSDHQFASSIAWCEPQLRAQSSPTAERSTLWRHGAAQPHPSIARAAAGNAAAERERERRAAARGELDGAEFFSLGLWHSALVLTGSWPDAESAAPPCAALQELMESVQRKQAGAAPAAFGQLEVFPEPG